MKTQLQNTLAIVSTLILVGCATPARVDQMVAKPVASATQLSFLRNSISVGMVAGGEETNPLWVSNVSSPDFSRALDDSLRGAGLLATNRESSKYLLSAHLNALQQPMLGIDMTVTATINYSLTDKSTGAETHKTTVVTPYTAKFGDALIGMERLKMANEGAIRQNLTQLIETLYGLKPGSVYVESKPVSLKTKEDQLQDAKGMFEKGLLSREVYLEQQKKIIESN